MKAITLNGVIGGTDLRVKQVNCKMKFHPEDLTLKVTRCGDKGMFTCHFISTGDLGGERLAFKIEFEEVFEFMGEIKITTHLHAFSSEPTEVILQEVLLQDAVVTIFGPDSLNDNRVVIILKSSLLSRKEISVTIEKEVAEKYLTF